MHVIPFCLPTSPADPDLYNATINATIQLGRDHPLVLELEERYHGAECEQLTRLWDASGEQEAR